MKIYGERNQQIESVKDPLTNRSTINADKNKFIREIKTLQESLIDSNDYSQTQYDIYEKSIKLLEDQISAYKNDERDTEKEYQTLDKEMSNILGVMNKYKETINDLEKKNKVLEETIAILNLPLKPEVPKDDHELPVEKAESKVLSLESVKPLESVEPLEVPTEAPTEYQKPRKVVKPKLRVKSRKVKAVPKERFR